MFVVDPKQLLSELSQKMELGAPGISWAVTGAAAANVRAPLLTGVDQVELIIPCGQAEAVAASLSLKPASKGGDVRLIERDGASTLFIAHYPELPSRCAGVLHSLYGFA